MSDPKPRSPNDQRSDVKNPNNPEHGLDQQNRERQKSAPRGQEPGPVDGPTPGQGDPPGQRQSENPGQGAEDRRDRLPPPRGDRR
ncbi:MAG: hypothetical protein H6703_17340 [Myxococcales bacterium]|nr:hypothetical protein [Myxococcales bacterium]MCB9544195.1 hypothetical protein [Myxococcales bacterium]MCB9551261.1 hypothetical protein [Myxococcales bacterium]